MLKVVTRDGVGCVSLLVWIGEEDPKKVVRERVCSS